MIIGLPKKHFCFCGRMTVKQIELVLRHGEILSRLPSCFTATADTGTESRKTCALWKREHKMSRKYLKMSISMCKFISSFTF